jgi:hypothetical protein
MNEDVRRQLLAMRALLEEHGWPEDGVAGADGPEAAWLVAQHAIGEPHFQRRCRTLLDLASAEGRVPRWQLAYLDDRVRVFEGKPQRFGTQIDLRPDGPQPHALEDPAQVDAWRQEVGLPPLAVALNRAQADPLPSPEQYAAKEAAGLRWRRNVGWVS